MYLREDKLFLWNAVKNFTVANHGFLSISIHHHSLNFYFRERHALLRSDLQITKSIFEFVFCFIVKILTFSFCVLEIG